MIPTRSASAAASSMSCVVRSERHACVAQLAQPVPHEQPRRRIEARRRLVEEEHLRRVHQRPRDHHPLRLAAGEEVGLDARALEQAELLQQLVRPRLALARRHAVVGGVEDQVVADRDRAVEVVALRHDRELRGAPHRVAADVDAADARRAARRAHARREHADGRRLAGAVRAEQPEHLALPRR